MGNPKWCSVCSGTKTDANGDRCLCQMSENYQETKTTANGHQITIEELQESIAGVRVQVVGCFGKGQNKAIYVTAKGNIEVENNKKVVWQGMQPFTAMEVYNAI